MTKVTNTTQSHLVLPNGPTVPAGSVRLVADDEWAKKNSSEVVKAWIAAGALVVTNDDDSELVDTDDDDGKGLDADADDDGNAGDVKLTEAQFTEMTNDALKEFIESKGGIVKSTWNKAELVAQAVEVQK